MARLRGQTEAVMGSPERRALIDAELEAVLAEMRVEEKKRAEA